MSPRNPERPIGIFGGSFNPVHSGHVAVAFALQERFHFDPLYIVPTRNPPHKPPFEISAADRLAMVRLAFEKVPSAEISEFELSSGKTNYSFDTIRHFRKLHLGREITLILGEDAASILPQWHRFPEVLGECHFLVVTRKMKKSGHDAFLKTWKMLEERNLTKNITRIELDPPDVSASELRHILASGNSARDKIPESVQRYITEHRLYLKE